MEWFEFAAALTVFLGAHTIPVRPPVKPFLIERIGERGFTLAYSLLSIGLLGWLISAAGRAPFVSLWYWQPWHNHVVLFVMFGVCLILALAVGRPNPFSFGGSRNDAFDPARPGIVGWIRHPLLAALALWGLAHVFANGDLAHVIMFGTFAVFAMLGGRLIDRRKRSAMGSHWTELRSLMRETGPPGPSAVLAEPLRLIVGTAGYALLILLHPHLFGVSPIAI